MKLQLTLDIHEGSATHSIFSRTVAINPDELRPTGEPYELDEAYREISDALLFLVRESKSKSRTPRSAIGS